MSKKIPAELVFQVFSLLIIIIVVHAAYVVVIRPNADAILEYQAEQVEINKDYVPEKSVYVLIRDFEQEACFILMFWALGIIGYKFVSILKERSLLESDVIQATDGMKFLPQDIKDLFRKVQSLPQDQQNFLVPRALQTSIERFNSSQNVQDVAQAMQSVCDAEYERLESELSIIRYIAWAIPSVGFLGTVRGIGDALGQAHKAVEGDIIGVTESLGVAFNSTFIALCISIVLMFIVHQLQLMQERFVFDTQEYCNRNLIRHLQTK
ncbi:MAG: MotA/TolQ/ExbB proton channel family protein [Pseudomonadota bacterium]